MKKHKDGYRFKCRFENLYFNSLVSNFTKNCKLKFLTLNEHFVDTHFVRNFIVNSTVSCLFKSDIR